MMCSPITTHVLNIETGKPARDIEISLFRKIDGDWIRLDTAVTDEDGRVTEWLSGVTEPEQGVYRLVFFTAAYFQQQGLDSLYPSVTIDFSVLATESHYHIPLLLSRNSFSTYRGS